MVVIKDVTFLDIIHNISKRRDTYFFGFTISATTMFNKLPTFPVYPSSHLFLVGFMLLDRYLSV